jgi:CheY-like chemotaxis protein/anti-sigma regulatory factor (Ser/Thr protein kinase)
MQRLIQDLLDATRIDARAFSVRHETVDPEAVAREAFVTHSPIAADKKIALEETIATPLPPIEGDHDRLLQALSNLLGNALKFTPEGGRVVITVSLADTTLSVRITDTGAGISPDFLPYVFDRFRQEDGATTRAHGGLGLGLSIVRHLVELHGGEVRAESEGEGRGSAFIVSLPLAQAPAMAGPYSGPTYEETEALPSLEGVRVLVVEDEHDARTLVAAVLQRQGAVVDTAGSVAEAIEALERNTPDVLLSDIAMPGVDGYELIRCVRAKPAWARLPAAALTAFVTPGDRGKVLLAGFDTHVPKPIEPAELTAVVAALVNKRPAASHAR